MVLWVWAWTKWDVCIGFIGLVFWALPNCDLKLDTSLLGFFVMIILWPNFVNKMRNNSRGPILVDERYLGIFL